jgi:hypothetical protein
MPDTLSASTLRNPRQTWFSRPEDEWKSVDSQSYEVVRSQPTARLRIQSSLELEFRRLAERWHDETQWTSSLTEIVLNENYQRVIGLGEPVVPLILQRLADSPDHWFWALHAITGVDPVRQEDLGQFHLMRAAWLAWGEATRLYTPNHGNLESTTQSYQR